MEEDIFKEPFSSSAIRNVLLEIASWSKSLSFIGWVYQIVILGFAVVHISYYVSEVGRTPHLAHKELNHALFELFEVAVFSMVYLLTYRSARLTQRACTIGSEEELEAAFKINLRIVKLNTVMLLLMIVYNTHTLWRSVVRLYIETR